MLMAQPVIVLHHRVFIHHSPPITRRLGIIWDSEVIILNFPVFRMYLERVKLFAVNRITSIFAIVSIGVIA